MTTPRRPMIAGNWKLHYRVTEAVDLVREILAGSPSRLGAEMVVAPVFTALYPVQQLLQAGGRSLGLAAQDVYWEDKGAYTGEVSAPLLRDVGCRYVLVGHSERRQLFGDSDERVRRKLQAVIRHGMQPILCVGETLEERQAGQAEDRVRAQATAALDGLSAEEVATVVIAYEPIWAIGTGQNAEPSDAQAAHLAIRRWAAQEHGDWVADGLRILYGGSVKPDNARALLTQPDVDGALVGGASLTADSFLQIVRAAD